MRTSFHLATFKGDLSGAITNAIIVIPMAIGYGIIVLAPLGAEYAPQGALMGVYTAVFCAFFASLIGQTPLQMTGPKAPLALVLASVVADLAVSPHIPESLPSRTGVILGLVALCIFIGGLVQIVFGSLRFGNLVKYIPSPVMYGFINGIALLLIVKQIKPLAGIHNELSLVDVLTHPYIIQPPTLAVGIVTLGALYWARRCVRLFPAPLVALVTGTGLYYVFHFSGSSFVLGPVIGSIPSVLPQPDAFLGLFRNIGHIHLWPLIPSVVIPGVFLGILGSMESLLSGVVCANLSGIRLNSQQELLGQGAGNIVSSIFGGISGAGSIPGVMANYGAGGKTRVAGMLSGTIVLGIIVILGPLVGFIPLSVIAGIVIGIALLMFDKQTLELLKHPAHLFHQQREVLVNLAVTLLVTVVTVSINLIIAVGVGIAVATCLFISKLGKSVIHRKYSGNVIHSKRVRKHAQLEFLENTGQKIVVFELRGPVFFGSADTLASEIENSMTAADYCILDMKMVNEIDSTGAEILLQVDKKLKREGKRLFISYLQDNLSVWELIKTLGGAGSLREDQFFPDTDSALELAENLLLSTEIPLTDTWERIPLSHIDVVQDFSTEELKVFQDKLVHTKVSKGQAVLVEGLEGRELFFLTKGSVSINLRLKTSGRLKRLVSFSPGVVFGEMALLEDSPRSANVLADEDSEMYQLSLADFETLRRDHPEIATKLILNLARELSKRLRLTSYEVRQLEEY